MLLLNLKHILHAVQAGRPAYQPRGRLQCAARKNHAIRSPVGNLQALAGSRKRHGVLADDVARPKHRKADAGRVTGGAGAMAAIKGNIAQSLAARPGNELPEAYGSTRGCVALHAVMSLGN